MDVIKQKAIENNLILKHPEPFVRLVDFGESAVKFQLFFWTNDVFRVEQIKSDLRVTLFEEFKKNGIQILFPQRVVHNKN